MAPVRKVGLEEELLLVHPETGELANAAGAVLHDHRVGRGRRTSCLGHHDPRG